MALIVAHLLAVLDDLLGQGLVQPGHLGQLLDGGGIDVQLLLVGGHGSGRAEGQAEQEAERLPGTGGKQAFSSDHLMVVIVCAGRCPAVSRP